MDTTRQNSLGQKKTHFNDECVLGELSLSQHLSHLYFVLIIILFLLLLPPLLFLVVVVIVAAVNKCCFCQNFCLGQKNSLLAIFFLVFGQHSDICKKSSSSGEKKGRKGFEKINIKQSTIIPFSQVTFL